MVRTGRSDENYQLGDRHQLQSWLSYRLRHDWSLSGRLDYQRRGNIDGFGVLITAPVQTADPNRHERDVVNASIGLNYLLSKDGHRLALEISAPLRQDFVGSQLEIDWQAVLGWQYAL